MARQLECLTKTTVVLFKRKWMSTWVKFDVFFKHIHFTEKIEMWKSESEWINNFNELFQVVPNGQKICTKCDLILANFKLPEVAVKTNFSETEKSSACINKTQQPATAAEVVKMEVKTKVTEASAVQTTGPLSKRAKKNSSFNINDKIWYYDRNTSQMEKGIVTRKENDTTNEDHASFHVNIKGLSKRDEWKKILTTFNNFHEIWIIVFALTTI